MISQKVKDRAKDLRLRREYHITLEEFKKVLDFQQGVCYICKKRLNKAGELLALAVDHCHTTGLVRGLLCWTCNKAIAILFDSEERAYNAHKYLKSPPFTTIVGERFTAPGKVGTKRRKKLLLKMAKGKDEQEVRKMVKKQKSV